MCLETLQQNLLIFKIKNPNSKVLFITKKYGKLEKKSPFFYLKIAISVNSQVILERYCSQYISSAIKKQQPKPTFVNPLIPRTI